MCTVHVCFCIAYHFLSFLFILVQSFDHDLEQEMIRRGSASLVSSGLYSLNSSVSQQLLSITIQAQEGETCKHACINERMGERERERERASYITTAT